MLQLEHKQAITDALKQWINEENPARSGNKLAEKCGVSASYISSIKNKRYEYEVNGRPFSISDATFYRLADALGIRFDGQLHWPFLDNFKRIQRACRKAQSKAIRMVIDGGTRMGKTFAQEDYAITNDYVVYVKCTQNMSSKDLLDEILTALGVHDLIRGNHNKLKMIKSMITRRKGYLIIIDEVEVVKAGIYGVIKDISDWANGKAGFIITGMDLIRKLQNLADRGKPGFPQLRGRFFGNKVVTASSLTQSEVIAVCDAEGITNRTAQNVLAHEVQNLDVLAQYVADIKEWQEKHSTKIKGEQVVDLLGLHLTTFERRAA